MIKNTFALAKLSGHPRLIARLLMCGVIAAGISACSSAPPAPDWQVGAKGSLERSTEAWLRGDAKIEAAEFARARSEVARTGRPDWVARVELVRCAAHVAALEYGPCEGFAVLAPDAMPPEKAYARYLLGEALTPAEVALLPKVHRALALAAAASTAGTSREAEKLLREVEEPLSRLVAAGVLLRRNAATPGTVQQAVDTASEMGWRRPLLAWLLVAKERAKAGGAKDEEALLQRRIDLLSPPAR